MNTKWLWKIDYTVRCGGHEEQFTFHVAGKSFLTIKPEMANSMADQHLRSKNFQCCFEIIVTGITRVEPPYFEFDEVKK